MVGWISGADGALAMPVPQDSYDSEDSYDSDDVAWAEAEEAERRREEAARLDEDPSSDEDELADRGRGASRERRSPASDLSSERDEEASALETSAMSATSTELEDGVGRLRLQPALSPMRDLESDGTSQYDDSDEDGDSRIGDGGSLLSESDATALGYGDGEDDDEEETEVLMRYVGVTSTRRELKISEVVDKVKTQVFKRALEASVERVPARSGKATRTWKATEEAELVQAIDEAADPRHPENFFATLADQLQRDEVDVRNKLMMSEKHVAMCYVRAFLDMEQLVTLTPRGPEIRVHDDNNHLLASHILANEMGRLKGQKQQLHRALRVDAQQVVDELEYRGPEDESERSNWEPIVTGWNVLRENTEVLPVPGTEDQVSHRIAARS